MCTCSGCFQARYVSQAARGQFGVWRATRPIDEVVGDPKTPERVKALLREVPAIREFGEANGLKPTKNYRSYADVKRSAVAWAVTACEPLRFKEKLWRFPIVGTVPYLGFFRESAAREYARKLESEGWEVDVRGVVTYSTLGWFKDPIASPMLPEGLEALGALVDVVLHESVHATLYLDDQTPFNESLASFVAPRLAADYLAEAHGSEAPEALAFAEQRLRIAHVDSALHGAWSELDALYRSDVADDEKRARKAEVLARVSADVGFEVNNATLVDARVYGAGLPELEALLDACDSDWPRFWRAVRSLDASDFGEEQAEDMGPALSKLVQSGCPAAD